MRRVIVLALLFGLMYVLQFLQVSAEAPFNAYSLATVGFILLAAYTFGEITGKIGMPKITGYILTGLLFGPYVINLFSVEVVDDLKTINDLAIGLIALSAGGEMKMSSLKQIAKSLTLIVLVKGGLILVAVTLTVWAIAPLMPFLAGASTPLILAVGSLFGVLAIGTSPAATIAVINETGARGRLADTTLGVAVFKDVVMVVLLAIAIALTVVFSSPDGAFDPHVLLVVGEELGLSILAGAVLGGLILLYIRFVHAEMWLFIIGIIFALTAFAHLFHLEALLLFIVAGFVVQNFSKHGDHFVHLIEGVALPVYVVFFSVAGAGLNLSALAAVGLVALILVVVRIAAIYGGTFLATKWAGEPAPIQKNAWLSFISQAGVVLGLTIIIENNLPELGPEIRVVVLGTIAVNLIAGPILFKMALARVGEVGMRDADDAAPEATPAVAEVPEAAEAILPLPPPEAHLPVPRFEADALQGEAEDLLRALGPIQDDFEEQFLARQTVDLAGFLGRMRDRYRQTMDALADDVADVDDPEVLANRFREAHLRFSRWMLSRELTFAAGPERAETAKQTFTDFFDAFHEVALRADERIVVMEEEARYQTLDGDSLRARVGKALKRAERNLRSLFGGALAARRVVPVRKVAQYHLEGTLPVRMEPVVNLAAVQPLFALEKARVLWGLIDDHFAAVFARLRGTDEAPPAPVDAGVIAAMRDEAEAAFESALADLGRHETDIRQHLAFALAQTYDDLFDALAVVGTFQLPKRQVRFSRIYEESRRAKQDTAEAIDRWQGYTRGLAGAFAKHLDVALLTDRVEAAVDETVLVLTENIREKLAVHVRAAHDACADARTTLADAFGSPDDTEAPSKDTPEGPMPEGTAPEGTAPEGTAPESDTAAEEAAPKAVVNASELRTALLAHQQALIDVLEARTLAPLRELRDSRALNALLDDLLQRFGALANEVPATYALIAPADLPPLVARSSLPPPPRLRTAPMREVARGFLDTKVAGNLAQANQTLLREVEAAQFALTEVSHVVRFNMQAALDELDRDGGDPEKALALALGGLDRALARLEKTNDQISQFDATVHTQIVGGTAGLRAELEKAIAGQTERRLRLQREQEKARARVARSAGQVGSTLRYRLRAFTLGLRRRFQPLAAEVVRDYRATLGLADLTPKEVLSRYDQAVLNPARLAALPFIYQKLFAFTPIETDDFLVGRADEVETFRLAEQRWAEGRACAVAIIGEPGGGTTSFLGHLRRTRFPDTAAAEVVFAHTPVSEERLALRLAGALGLARARTLEEVARRLRSRPEAPPPVVFLHDLHHVYRPAPGGFDLLKQLLLLIATTGDRVRWVASMNRPAWHYLNAVVEVADAFAFHIDLGGLSRHELEDALMTRHRLSGLDLQFLPSGLMRQRRRYRRAEPDEQQAMLRTAFFDQLYRLTEGNPLAAQFHWLRAIDEVRDEALLMGPPVGLKLGYVSALDVEDLLTLATVLRRGYLTPEEHAPLFGIGVGESRATLTHLTNLNLLRHTATGAGNGTTGRYRLHRPVYKALAAQLKALNILS